MTSAPVTLTIGWIGRHTPPGAGVDGRDAAVIDIAQDLLLRELHGRGVLDTLAFKGGTSLRKRYAGNQGRFSLDLDFSVASPADDPDTVLLSLISEIDGLTAGPFAYGVTERRGKWWLTIRTEFASADSALSSKLDVSPPPWLDPVRRAWVPMPVHATYGTPGLPELQVVRLEENIAEKISRLNRTTTARDLYDLAWLATHQRQAAGLDTGLIRRLAVLKIWSDANGIATANIRWKPGHEPRAFDPGHWLRTRAAAEVDLADIGALAVPTPSLADLNTTIQAHYGFLRNLDPDERQLAARDVSPAHKVGQQFLPDDVTNPGPHRPYGHPWACDSHATERASGLRSRPGGPEGARGPVAGQDHRVPRRQSRAARRRPGQAARLRRRRHLADGPDADPGPGFPWR